MPHPLDLDLLKSFIAVTESGSLSHAAPQIGRSQSAVSMQIQRLEQAVGKQLLVRSARHVTPTAAGADLLVYARRLLKLSDEAWASITRPDVTGEVRLGVPDDYAAFLLPPVLSRFSGLHPYVTVELICEPSQSLGNAIERNQIDLAIVTRAPAQQVEVLRQERFVWVASPHHVTWENDPLPVALFEPGCAARENILHALSEAGRRHRCLYSSSSLLGLTAIVQAGLAVAGLAACSVPESLRIIGDKEGLPALTDLDLSLLRSRHAKSDAVICLQDFLRDKLSETS